MGAIAIVGLILGNLPALISVVEMMFSMFGSGKGPLKKEVVLSVASAVVDTIGKIPGNAETLKQKEQILDITSKATDTLVAGMNAMGWGNPATVGSDR